MNNPIIRKRYYFFNKISKDIYGFFIIYGINSLFKKFGLSV